MTQEQMDSVLEYLKDKLKPEDLAEFEEMLSDRVDDGTAMDHLPVVFRQAVRQTIRKALGTGGMAFDRRPRATGAHSPTGNVGFDERYPGMKPSGRIPYSPPTQSEMAKMRPQARAQTEAESRAFNERFPNAARLKG